MDNDITFKDVCLDVLISTALIVGAWVTNYLGDILFPLGIPLTDSIPIYGRVLISYMWITRMVARYSVGTFNEINSAILSIINTQTWQAGQGFAVSSAKSLWKCWGNMDNIPRILTIIVLIIGLSLPLFMFTQNSADLWLPPAYGAAALLFAYLFEKDNLTRPGARRYWLAILILFCVIQICIGIGIVDLLHLNNADVWSEIWELIIQLPNTQLSLSDNLRVLISMSVMYMIADNVYQRDEAHSVNYAENMKQFFDRAKRGMNWCSSIPPFAIA